MNKYLVEVCLQGTYEVEADSEEEAFVIASDYAMSGGSWDYSIDTIEEDIEED